MNPRLSVLARWGGGLAMIVLSAGAAFAQTGTVTGTVTAAETGQPIAGAQVYLEGTRYGAITQENGRYLILNVPAGTYTAVAQSLGYATGRETGVSVGAEESRVINFSLATDIMRLEEVVVTGVVGETPRVKMPITVEKLSAEDLPVPAVSADAMLQGKVAGVQVISGSGKPGDGASILLRGPTSINAAGRSQEPLYIVDGVILASGMEDIAAEDIENIEVVKGAAAASLYGSRAANGVVQITTKKGSSLGDGATRFTFRSEYGQSSLPRKLSLSQYHPYQLNGDGTKFIADDGSEVDYDDGENLVLETGNSRTTFQDNPYPGTTYDQIDRFFSPGGHMQNYLGVAGRSGNTNFYASVSMLDEEGVLPEHEGYERLTARANVDHGLREDLQLSVSGAYSTSTQDEIGTGPFFALTFMSPAADLLKTDEDGSLVIQPDIYSLEDNPLYQIRAQDREDKRQRFTGGATLRYSPISWFNLEGSLSYDRVDLDQSQYYEKGYKTVDSQSPLRTGYLYKEGEMESALTGSVTAAVNRSFGDLVMRTRLRYLYESEHTEYHFGDGYGLSVPGVPSLDVVSADLNDVGSSVQDIRSEGFFFITGLDYKDRYVLDGLVRRDGSSLFGPEERWQTYYRLSGAWRISEESFWNLDAIDEFKVRYSLGTAGGRPRFTAQYETYSISSGFVTPQVLGNANLKPEFATEQEFGIDLVAFNRLSLSLNYATSTIEDQLLQVPLRTYNGFTQQWRNAGALKSNTFEASLEAMLVNTEDLTWSSRLLFDRTRQEITRLDVPPYQWGINMQGLGNAFYNREGEALGTFYGYKWATSCADLAAGVDCSQFQVNDDGYLVYVGADNSYQDGNEDVTLPDGSEGDRWETNSGALVNPATGSAYEWGMPIRSVNSDGESVVAIGGVMPDFNLGFANTVNWKGVSLYALVDASQGFDIYNQVAQWGYREFKSGDVDQVGKPDGLKKPLDYYSTLYAANSLSSHFVEDGSFVKLREVSLSYSFDNSQLASLGLGRFDRVRLSLIGRNLHTWTDYSGYDPEVGTTGGTGGSALLNRFDAFGYPNFRTLTGSIEVVF